MPSIEEVLPHTLFRNSYHKASVNLAYTAFWLQGQQENMVAAPPHRLSWVRFCVLTTLRERYPYGATAHMLEERFPHIPAEAVSQACQKLVKRGLAEHNEAPLREDEKGFRASKEGLELLSRMDSQKVKRIDRIIETLSPGEAEELTRLLNKIRG